MVSTVKFIASAHWVNHTKETFNKYFFHEIIKYNLDNNT